MLDDTSIDDTAELYLEAKAEMLLAKGIEVYRSEDAFGMPPKRWGPATHTSILNGARQVADGLGRSAEAPLTGIGVEGIQRLMETFHFRFAAQEIVGRMEFTDDGGYTVTDQMRFNHVVDGREVMLYNRVVCPPHPRRRSIARRLLDKLFG